MKKILFIVFLALTSIVYGQNSFANYKEGNQKLNEDLNNNIIPVLKEYNFNGQMQVQFSVNKEGEIENIKTIPTVDNDDFNIELRRSIKRVNKGFAVNVESTKDSAVFVFPITFYSQFKEGYGGALAETRSIKY